MLPLLLLLPLEATAVASNRPPVAAPQRFLATLPAHQQSMVVVVVVVVMVVVAVLVVVVD